MKIWMFLLVFSLPVAATEVYRTYDEQGNVVFSDSPSANAEKVDVEPAFTYTPVDIPLLERPSPSISEVLEEAAVAPDYQVSIVSPEADEAVRANDGNVTLNVQIHPPLDLQRGDQLQLRRNGAPFGPIQTSLSFPLQNLDRGTHKFTVSVLNASGEVIGMSPAVSFHVLRNSIVTNPPARIPGMPPARPAPSPGTPPAAAPAR